MLIHTVFQMLMRGSHMSASVLFKISNTSKALATAFEICRLLCLDYRLKGLIFFLNTVNVLLYNLIAVRLSQFSFNAGTTAEE